MKKLSVLSLILMFVFIGCVIDTHNGVDVIVTNETSHNVKYRKSYSDNNVNIELPYGQKTRIFAENHYCEEGIPPILGCFIFDDSLTLQYKQSDTFSRSIYKNYEVEKPYDYKRNSQTNYYYTLTEEDYQNALKQQENTVQQTTQ